MRIKHFLIATAVTEGGTGLGLALAPALPASMLLGVTLVEPAAMVIARVTGAALIALALVCWFARDEARSRATHGLLIGVLVYDVAVVALLAHAGLVLHLGGIDLWPAIALHTVMAVWCGACLRSGR